MFGEDKWILISSFIDDELTDKEKDYVKSKIENDPEWKNIYITFLDNKKSFVDLKELSFDNNSKEGIMAKIRRGRAEEYKNTFLPFPKRYVPAVAALLVAAIVFASLFLINQHPGIINFIDRNADITKNYYDNIFNNDLYPLNASLTNQDLFRFAAFGIVSTESEKNQYVQIGDDESGFFVKIVDEKDVSNNNMNLQLSEVFEKLNVDETQQKKIENVLDSYKENIETAVLATPDDYLAVDPYAWVFRQSLVSDLASELSENQKKEIDMLLRSSSTSLPKHKIIFAMNDNDNSNLKKRNFYKINAKRDFIVITSDTMLVVNNIEINYDSIRHKARHTKRMQKGFTVELDISEKKDREIKIDIDVMGKNNKRRYGNTNNRLVVTYNSKEGHIPSMNFKDTILIQMLNQIDENFKGRKEPYEGVRTRWGRNNNRRYQRMLKYQFETQDSTNKFFYDSLPYQSRDKEGNRIILNNLQFNEMMNMDSMIHHYKFLQKDSTIEFFNGFQFDNIDDMNAYLQKFQVQFCDSMRG